MKSKAIFIIPALVVLAAVAYLASQPKGPDPYETFTLVMDRLSGPDQWSDQGHEHLRDGLTVRGLALIMTPEGRPEGPPIAVAADSVFIKKPASKSQAEKILSLADWRDQPGLSLAEAVRFRGLSIRETSHAGEVDIAIKEMNLDGVKLAQASKDAPAGADGFLKALRLDSLSYKNFRLDLKGPEGEASADMESASFEDLSLGGDIPPELAALEADALFRHLAALSVKSLKARELKLDFSGLTRESPLKAALSLASLEGKDIKALKAASALTLDDFKSGWTDDQGHDYTLDLAGASVRGLDAADYLGRFLAGLVLAKDNPDRAEALLNSHFTMADFFVSPISLEEASLTGLNFDLAGLASLKLDEFKSEGAYQAGEIPPAAKNRVKGLKISLTGDSEAKAGTPGRDIHDFIRVAGRNAFDLELDSEITYEAQTGLMTHRLNNLASRDLFDLSFDFSLGGLTTDRLERFKKLPIGAFYLAALNPGDFFGDASFNALNIKYADHGLVDIIFNFKAQEEDDVTGAEMKQRTMAETDMMIAVMGGRYLKNTEDLRRPLLDFLKAPRSLEIDLKAVPPLSFPMVQDLGLEPMAILDALNITFSANGQAGAPLRFMSPGGGYSPEFNQDSEFDDQY
jgi:hypothetical protein